MEELVGKLDALLVIMLQVLPLVAQGLGALTVAATVVARLTPSKSDDEKVSKVASKVWGVIEWLPTIGVNPRTKALKDSLEEAKK